MDADGLEDIRENSDKSTCYLGDWALLSADTLKRRTILPNLKVGSERQKQTS